MNRDELQQLVDHCLSFAESLLVKHGEFFPFAASVNSQGEFKSVGTYDNNDQPLSETVIHELRRLLDIESSTNIIRGYSIAYDCSATKNPESEKVDAVAIEAYPVNGQRLTYYYPYVINGNLIEFGEPWGVVNDR